jgi:hypothetical protein
MTGGQVGTDDTAEAAMVKQGEPALVTVGRQRRPFACHVCEGTVFGAHKVQLNTAVAYRLGDQFADSAISLACQGCGYLHTFVPGLLELWPAKDGYPAAS